jgi:hypothetical protein
MGYHQHFWAGIGLCALIFLPASRRLCAAKIFGKMTAQSLARDLQLGHGRPPTEATSIILKARSLLRYAPRFPADSFAFLTWSRSRFNSRN